MAVPQETERANNEHQVVVSPEAMVDLVIATIEEAIIPRLEELRRSSLHIDPQDPFREDYLGPALHIEKDLERIIQVMKAAKAGEAVVLLEWPGGYKRSIQLEPTDLHSVAGLRELGSFVLRPNELLDSVAWTLQNSAIQDANNGKMAWGLLKNKDAVGDGIILVGQNLSVIETQLHRYTGGDRKVTIQTNVPTPILALG